MRRTLIVLALATSPALAQVPPLYPMPTPPVVHVTPMVPMFPVFPIAPYSVSPVAPIATPQYIYRNYGGSALTYPTPDFAIVPGLNGTTVYRTVPNSSLYDITQPMYTIK